MPTHVKFLHGEMSAKIACFCFTEVLNGKNYNLSYI